MRHVFFPSILSILYICYLFYTYNLSTFEHLLSEMGHMNFFHHYSNNLHTTYIIMFPIVYKLGAGLNIINIFLLQSFKSHAKLLSLDSPFSSFFQFVSIGKARKFLKSTCYCGIAWLPVWCLINLLDFGWHIPFNVNLSVLVPFILS